MFVFLIHTFQVDKNHLYTLCLIGFYETAANVYVCQSDTIFGRPDIGIPLLSRMSTVDSRRVAVAKLPVRSAVDVYL